MADPIKDAVDTTAHQILNPTDPLSGVNLGLDDAGEDVVAEAAGGEGGEEVAADTTEKPENAEQKAGEDGGGEEQPKAPVAEGSSAGDNPPPAADSSKPEPIAAAAAPAKTPEPPADPEVKAFTDRLAKYQTDRDALKAKIAGGTFDPLDDAKEQARLALEREELQDLRDGIVTRANAAREQQEQQERAMVSAWDAWGKQHADVGGTEWGQKVFNEEYEKAAKKYGHEGALAIANEKLTDRVTLVRAQKAAAKAKETPKPAAPKVEAKTPPKAPTMAIPPGGQARRVPQKEDDPAAEFDKAFAGQASRFLN